MKHIRLFGQYIDEQQYVYAVEGIKSITPIIDILVNSMEDMSEDEFIDIMFDYGYNSGKQLYDDYWKVSPKDRMNWDTKEWTKWLNSHGIK
jgi:hypothetical protein